MPESNPTLETRLLRARIAELEAALRTVVDAWHAAGSQGRDPMVPAIEHAEDVLPKLKK